MWSSVPAYFFFALFCLLLPGIGIQKLCRVAPHPSLVLPLGAAVTACTYWLSRLMGGPAPFVIGTAGVAAAAFLRARRGGQPALVSGALPPWAAVVGLLAATVYPLHRLDAQGEFLFDGESALAADTAFHVGVTRELTMTYPPQVPGLAGFPLSYHLGLDLLRAAALQWAHVDPYDSINRLDVTLWALALILALRGAAQAIGAPPLAVTIAGWSLVAGDFSFVFAGNAQAHWWTDLLRGNALLSVVYANPIVPGLALALGSLIALARHRENGDVGWLVLAGFQAFAVAFFKVFLGAHLALGLGVAAILSREARVFGIAALALLSTALLALGSTASGVDVAFAPLDLANVTRETLALPRLHGFALAGWSILWLAASLGLRWLGLGPAWQALRSRSAAAIALAAMALSGWPLGLIFQVAPPDAVAGQKPINDAAFLVEQSGALLWIFAAVPLAHLARRRSRLVVFAAAALLSLPSTVHFVAKKAQQAPHPLPASTVRAMQKVAEITHAGEVVLQRPGALYPPAPVVLIGRRVPYERFTPYLTQFAPKADLERRHEIVHRFFQGAGVEEARAIAQTLGTRVLCLYDRDPRLGFDVRVLYDVVYEEPGVAVYRLKSMAD
jgi:hypothetical protein